MINPKSKMKQQNDLVSRREFTRKTGLMGMGFSIPWYLDRARYFQDHDKGLVLNVTNTRAIEAAYGAETDDWVGKSIELFGSETPFQGKSVPCVRVRLPREPSADELTSPGDPDDEIPF